MTEDSPLDLVAGRSDALVRALCALLSVRPEPETASGGAYRAHRHAPGPFGVKHARQERSTMGGEIRHIYGWISVTNLETLGFDAKCSSDE